MSYGTIQTEYVPVFHQQPQYAQDPETGEGPKADILFNDHTIRAAFVRKVFVMVGIMVSRGLW